MGLDTYAGRTPVDFFDPNLDEPTVDEDFGCTWRDRLAFWWAEKRRNRAGGGLFSGNYLRGGIYADLVEFVTGVRLAQTWIPPETVREMAGAFARADPAETIRDLTAQDGNRRGHGPSDVADLAAYFAVCARRGLGLVGSW